MYYNANSHLSIQFTPRNDKAATTKYKICRFCMWMIDDSIVFFGFKSMNMGLEDGGWQSHGIARRRGRACGQPRD
jgi:hypothetical protein